MQKQCPLVLAHSDGPTVRVSDAVDPLSGRARPLVIEAECLPVRSSDGAKAGEPVPETKGKHDAAIFTIAMFVIVAVPLAALLYLACVKGWI